MRLQFDSNRKPLTLKLLLKVQGQQEIMVSVSDPIKPFTYYFKSSGIIVGTQSFFVSLPLTPEKAVIDVYNVKNGNLPYGEDKSFSLLSITPEPLIVDLTSFDSANATVKNFIQFFLPFCEKAGYLATDETEPYTSKNGQFAVRYVDVIKEGGVPIISTARVESDTGIMDFSKKYFKLYTIPERFLIGTHEFSHYWVNVDKKNEFEADRNGLMMYLGLGFPRREALFGWLKVFGRAETGQNARRYKMIEEFVMEFDPKKHLFKI